MANPEWDNYEPKDVKIREATRTLIENGYVVEKNNGMRMVYNSYDNKFHVKVGAYRFDSIVSFVSIDDALDKFLGQK